MKKSIFNVALLAMLFVLGACSVEPEPGNPAADKLPDVGDTTGFTQYLFTASENQPAEYGGGTYSCADQYFLNADAKTYKNAGSWSLEGNSNPESNGSGISTEEGTYTLVDVTADKVIFSVYDDKGNPTETPVTDLKGFNKVYIFTPTKATEDGVDIDNPDHLSTSTYLVKLDASSLKMIRANDNSDGTYRVSGSVEGGDDTFEKLADQAQTFTKQ